MLEENSCNVKLTPKKTDHMHMHELKECSIQLDH